MMGEKKCSLANTNGVVDAEISNDGDLYTISSNIDYNEIVYQYDLPNIKKFYWTDLNNGNVSYRDKYDNVSDYTGRVVKEVTDTAILIYKNGELTQTIPLSSAISAVKEEIRKALDSYQNVDCAGESYPSERESERPSSYTSMITMTVEKEHIDRDGKCWATVSFWAYGNCYPYISHEYNMLDADFTDSDEWDTKGLGTKSGRHLPEQEKLMAGLTEQMKWYTPDTFHTGLKTLEAPVLVVWGEKDAVIGVEAVEEIKQNLKEGEYLILKDVGHTPILEADYPVSEAYLKFLTKAQAKPNKFAPAPTTTK